MKQRVITGTILLVALILILVFAWTPVLPAVIAAAAVIGIYEMACCIGLKKAYVMTVPLYILASAYPFLIRYFHEKDVLRQIDFIIFMCVPLYFFAVMTFSGGKYTLNDVSVLFTTTFYIFLGFNSLIILYCHRTEYGILLLMTVFIGSWATDMFAYFSGVLFGKHKLIPSVSPKKTVEGSIGGTLLSTLFMVGFGWVCSLILPNLNVNLLIFALGGFVASIVSQVGDLLMSVIKRTYGIKDYGKVFAGHGGVMDRFDSVIAVSIALAALSSFFQFFEVV